MKIDLGNYEYCESDELVEIGKITGKSITIRTIESKINGTLFRTLGGVLIFYGKISRLDASIKWRRINKLEEKTFLSVLDNLNEENKWDILGYTKVE